MGLRSARSAGSPSAAEELEVYRAFVRELSRVCRAASSSSRGKEVLGPCRFASESATGR